MIRFTKDFIDFIFSNLEIFLFGTELSVLTKNFFNFKDHLISQKNGSAIFNSFDNGLRVSGRRSRDRDGDISYGLMLDDAKVKEKKRKQEEEKKGERKSG